MNQELIALLPKASGILPIVAGAIGCIAGLAFWLVGSRGNRSLITLVFVMAGSITGMCVPRWFDVAISSWAIATVMALLSGWIGFTTYRFWSGMLLGILIAWCALVVVLQISRVNVTPVIVARDAGVSWRMIAVGSWQSVAMADRLMLIVAVCSSMCAGLTIAMVWHRFGMALLYSLLGYYLMAISAIYLAMTLNTNWLYSLQLKPLWVWASSSGFVLLGTLGQWRWSGGRVVQSSQNQHLQKYPIEVAL